MIRTQIQLSEKQYAWIREQAYREKVSLSEIIRRLVRDRQDRREKPTGSRKSAIGFVGAGKDKNSDVSNRHDDYLAGLLS